MSELRTVEDVSEKPVAVKLQKREQIDRDAEIDQGRERLQHESHRALTGLPRRE